MSRLTLPQLSAFLKLAETSSFREAATQLGVSQPALSRTIQHIETRIGARLFDRDTRTVMLTPAGERLRPAAIRLLEEYETVFRELHEFVEGREGVIRIATLPSVASALLPKAIMNFQSRYPNVRFDIWEDVGEPVHQIVRERGVDIGIAPPPQIAGELRYQTLLKDSLVFVSRVDDPLAQADVHNWNVFSDRRFISTSEETGLRQMVESAMTQAGVMVECLFNCKQPTTVASLIIAGQGISALTHLTIEQIASPLLTWRPLVDPMVSRSIGIVRHNGRSLSPAAQLFVREVERQARTMRMRKVEARTDEPAEIPA